MPVKLTYEFVKEQIEKEKYKLISTEYKNANTKLKIECPKNHIYEVKYNNFKQGQRCPICNGGIKLTYEFVKEQIEKEKYKLISTEYKNNHAKLKIECSKNHIYEVSYNIFKQGHRCPICYNKKLSRDKKLSYEYVKEKIKKKGYELLSNEYNSAKSRIYLKCNNNHKFKTTWDSFNHNSGCPICSTNFSKSEKEISEYIKSLNIEVIENNRELIYPLELDIVIPEKKIAIEYCGLYWHSELYKDKNYHLNKLEKCNQAGYKLITIFEDEWIYKQDIVKNRLKYILGLNTKRIYARKCNIKEISKEQSKVFVDKYHIQGHVNATIYLGAFYNEELVAVNTFIKKKDVFELNRFCINNNIIGIASKFIKYFQNNYKYNKIVTFADRRWSEGKLYETIGFIKDKELDPDYSYTKKYNGERIRFHKFGFRHIGMKNKLENYDSNLSEKENMLNNGWLRIYDCGKIKYIINGV